MRRLRQADGISVVQRQARLPVPPRPHHRQHARPRAAEESVPRSWQHPGPILLANHRGFLQPHRSHRVLKQAAPLRPLPDGAGDQHRFHVRRRDHAGGVIHEYRLAAWVLGTRTTLVG
jgi:hypothetical protein